MTDRDEEERVGLCATCAHVRRVDHPRGGNPYWLCGLAETDDRFRKFPPLPVRSCAGYTNAPER